MLIPKIFSHQSYIKKEKSELFPRGGPKKGKQLFDERENDRMKKSTKHKNYCFS